MPAVDSTPEPIDPKVKAAREKRLRWYYKNREKANAANKAWIAANRERKNEANRQWCAKPENKGKKKAWHARWMKNNPEKLAAMRKAYRERRRDHLKTVSRRNHLRREYGLTPAQYDALLASQQGRCAVCSTDDPAPLACLCVDHCHKTGAVRGLLCFNCNVSIGRMRDDPELLKAAITYLEKSR
jgi:hypothetical protein